MIIKEAVSLAASGAPHAIMGDFNLKALQLSALARHVPMPTKVIDFGPTCFSNLKASNIDPFMVTETLSWAIRTGGTLQTTVATHAPIWVRGVEHHCKAQKGGGQNRSRAHGTTLQAVVGVVPGFGQVHGSAAAEGGRLTLELMGQHRTAGD